MSRFELKLGDYFEEYEIKKELGRGGLSIVYSGNYQDDMYVDNCAFKIFTPDERFSDIERLKVRFKFEQWMTSRFRFNHLLTGSWGDYKGIPYIKYGTIAEVDLKEFIRINDEKLTINKGIKIILDILMGVSFLHANGFIHRDLKPNNILLYNNRAIVGDFGITRYVIEKNETDTKTNDIMGSRDYIAPEQRENPKKATEKSDIYSLGVIFYELVTKRLPTYNYFMIKNLNHEFSFLDPVIEKMLEYNPEKRHEDIIHVANHILTNLIKENLIDSDLQIFINYPFMAALYARTILEKQLNGLNYYYYPLYNVEDLINYSKYWLKEPTSNLIKIHIPTLRELSASEPKLVIKNKIDEFDMIKNLQAEIDWDQFLLGHSIHSQIIRNLF